MNPNETILKREQLRDLTEFRGEHCVSLYMPTHRSGGLERKQDPIRLKNLLHRATEELVSAGMRRPEASDLLRGVESLQGDESFWRVSSDGLAIFCAPQMQHVFRVPLQLDQTLMVSDRFIVRPLLPLLHAGGRFYLLSLTQEVARFYEATDYALRELAVNLPGPQARDPEQHLAFHSHNRATTGGMGPTTEAIFHGQGGSDDQEKIELINYFREVDHAVCRLLRAETAPLVLACVGYVASLYESVNSYSNLLKAKVPGSPRMWSEEELRQRAWQHVEPHFNQQRIEALNQYREAQGTERAASDPRDVLLAASHGRVETLFVTRGRQLRGRVEPELSAVHFTGEDDPNGEDLLDYAVVQTLTKSGEVYVLDQGPHDGSPLAALLRY